MWHPLGGMDIEDISVKRVLFRFFSEVDRYRINEDGSWFFNRHVLVIRVWRMVINH